jgi:hypothetical protein
MAPSLSSTIPTEKLTELDVKSIKGKDYLLNLNKNKIFHRSKRTFTCCLFS